MITQILVQYETEKFSDALEIASAQGHPISVKVFEPNGDCVELPFPNVDEVPCECYQCLEGFEECSLI